MLSRIQSLGSCLTVFTLLVFAGSAAARDVSPRCEAAMDRTAGDYSQCLLRAEALYPLHENLRKLKNRKARCDRRFDRRTSRVIKRYGADQCTSTELVAAMGDRTSMYADGIASEASGHAAASFFFVQNAAGGTLTESTLTLTKVDPVTGWFSDRPYRTAGQVSTDDFISQWDVGEGSLSDDPPNADFTCEVGDGVVNYVVELTDPRIFGDSLSYSVVGVGSTVLPQALQCESYSHLFISGRESARNYCFYGGVVFLNIPAFASCPDQ